MIALNDRTRLTVLPMSFKFSAERKEEQIKTSALLFYAFFHPLGVSIYTFGAKKTHSASKFNSSSPILLFRSILYTVGAKTPSFTKSAFYPENSLKKFVGLFFTSKSFFTRSDYPYTPLFIQSALYIKISTKIKNSKSR